MATAINYETTGIMANKNPMNPGFRKYLDERLENHNQLKDLIALMFEDQTQPLSALEVKNVIENEFNVFYDVTSVRLYLKQLEEENRLVSRTETPDERRLRAKTGRPTGYPATLYFSASAGVKTPPARTVSDAVPGVLLKTPGKDLSAKRRLRHEKRIARHQARAQAATQPMANATRNVTVEQVIEHLVNERTAQLHAELADTKAKLEAIQRLLR